MEGIRDIKLNIKPISVKKCYNGQRTKSKAYYAYEKEMLLSLPPSYQIDTDDLGIYYEFGVSSKGGDVDNLIKCCQDCICKKYGINDNRIYEITARKVIVPKGKEYIKFEIKTLTKKAQ